MRPETRTLSATRVSSECVPEHVDENKVCMYMYSYGAATRLLRRVSRRRRRLTRKTGRGLRDLTQRFGFRHGKLSGSS